MADTMTLDELKEAVADICAGCDSERSQFTNADLGDAIDAAIRERDELRGTPVPKVEWQELMERVERAEAALAQAAEPVAWSCQDTINDDDGCPIGMDEPRVHWGSVCPDDDGGWSPLYSRPQPAQDAKDAARYRWLRDKSRQMSHDPDMSGNHHWLFGCNISYALRGPTADAAIDDAMAKESGNG